MRRRTTFGLGRAWLAAGALVVMVAVATGTAFLWDRDERQGACAPWGVGATIVSTYEWRTDAWRSPGARDDLVRRARDICVGRVYVDVTGAATARGAERSALAADVTALVRRAADEQIEVGAVAGDRWWPSPQGELDATAVLAFVAELEGAGVALAGLHIDAEPWGLDEWPTGKVALTSAHLRLVEHLETERARLGTDVTVTYLIPYWWDGSNGEAPSVLHAGSDRFPFDHLVDLLGPGASVAVMAYRDRASGDGGIVDLVRQELAQTTVPVVVGVETAPIDPPSATFAGASASHLRHELAVVAVRTGTPEIAINDFPHLHQLVVSG